jgi:cytochrome P450
VSPTAIAALYGRTEVTDIPASWLGALPPVRQADMPTLTMQAWTCLTFIHVFVNLVNAAEGARLGERAAFELLSHIGDLIERARLGSAPRNTLLSNLVAGNPADFGITASQYDEHVRLILMEITVSSVGTICKALTNWVDVALDNPDLMRLVRTAVHEQLTHPELHDEKDAEIEGLILEGLRFAPVSSALFRVATKRATIGGQPVRRGTSVALLLEAAMQDQRAFRNPNDIVATRQRNLYLHFADTSPHVCYAGRLALVELREIVKALIGLKNLRRAAGPRGVKAEQFRLPQSLVVRFDPA